MKQGLMQIRTTRGGKRALPFMLVILLLVIPLASATTQFTNQNALHFTGTSSAPGTLYQDAIGDNADVGIELCDFGSRFVGGFYALDVLGTFQNVLITYQSSTNALGDASTPSGGSCFQTSAGFITVSPSTLTTPDPDVYQAAFPGYLWTGYDTVANPGTVTTFDFGGANMSLRGSYSITRSFDQVTRNIDVSTPQITFLTSSGSFSKSASDASFGISSDRRMVLGVCEDDYGASCSDGEVLTTAAGFPESYSTGLSAPQVNDQNTHTRYVVANGLGYETCIGANLDPTITAVTPNPVYYSQNLSITYNIGNPRDTPFELDGGNVDVDTDFDVNVVIYNTSNPSYVVYNQTTTITNTIAPDGTEVLNIIWPALRFSGVYTILVTADVDDDIDECNEADNTASTTFTLLPITLPEIYIDGNQTTEFPFANIPYNLSFYFKNSDNVTLSDAYVELTEENGLAVNVPTQTWNATNASNETTQRGLFTTTTTQFYTDIDGNISFTFIPTYNKFYLSEYTYVNLSGHVGDYSLYFSGNQSDGQEFIFITNGNVETQSNFTIQTVNATGPFTTKELPNENIAAQALDFVYQVYSNFLYIILN